MKNGNSPRVPPLNGETDNQAAKCASNISKRVHASGDGSGILATNVVTNRSTGDGVEINPYLLTRSRSIKTSCRMIPRLSRRRNIIVLSDEFYRELTSHPIPTDLKAVRILQNATSFRSEAKSQAHCDGAPRGEDDSLAEKRRGLDTADRADLRVI